MRNSVSLLLLPLGACLAQADILSGGLAWLPVDQTTNWAYVDIRQEFGTGGQFEGYRHATLPEVWSLTAGYGFAPEAPAESNYAAISALQGDLGYTFASSAGQFNSWTLAFTGEGTRFDLRITLPDFDDAATWQGFAYETDYPFPDLATPEIGHYLVMPVPEPAAAAALLGLLAIAASLFRHSRK